MEVRLFVSVDKLTQKFPKEGMVPQAQNVRTLTFVYSGLKPPLAAGASEVISRHR